MHEQNAVQVLSWISHTDNTYIPHFRPILFGINSDTFVILLVDYREARNVGKVMVHFLKRLIRESCGNSLGHHICQVSRWLCLQIMQVIGLE